MTDEGALADSERRFAELMANSLARAEQRLLRGDTAAILDAVFDCALAGMLPEWLCRAFRQAYGAVKIELLHASWDDVFGRPHGKNTKLAAAQRDRAYRWAVYAEICDRRGQRPRKDHFAEVAAKYGIGEAVARKYYRKASRMMRSADPRVVRFAASQLAEQRRRGMPLPPGRK
jgi:hypothetical protein